MAIKDKQRILIVDDEEYNINILMEALKSEHKIVVAKNGEQALKMVHKNKIDLILLDIIMPGMDGYEVCKQLKAQETTRGIPVIFITAKTEIGDEKKGLEIGAIDYITKPFCRAIVKARVNNHLFLKMYRDHLEELVKVRTIELENEREKLKMTNTALKAAKMEADQANQVKTEFLMNMSHELRTPLNGIVAASDLALSYQNEERLQQILDIIQVSSKNLLGLINNMLDFSKSENNRIQLDEVPFLLHTVLGNLKKIYYHKSVVKTLDLNINVPSPPLPNALIGDVQKLKNILHQLLDNATKFTQNNPKVILTVAATEITPEKAVIQFALTDNGIGIPESFIHKIFNPFFQLDTTTTRPFDGAGIGLTICRRLVQLMNGEITVESVFAQGTTFTFTIPFRRQKKEVLFQLPQAQSDIPPNIEGELTTINLKDEDREAVSMTINALTQSLENMDHTEITGNIKKLEKFMQNALFTQLVIQVEEYEYDQAMKILKEISLKMGQ